MLVPERLVGLHRTSASCGTDEEFACNVGALGLIPGLGRSPGEGKGYPLQYSGLQNSVDSIVHGVAKSQTPLTDLHFHSSENVFLLLYSFSE